MKHSIEDVLSVIYMHYPRGIPERDSTYVQTEENLRLVETRKAAGGERQRWLAMLARIGQRFPDCYVHDGSLHLPLGKMDACHSGELFLPTKSESEAHHVGFQISFLLPYYVVYGDAWVVGTDTLDRHPVRLSPEADEQVYFDGLAEEIETRYRCEPVPADVGRLIIPDLELPFRSFGRVTIFDCLFSEYSRWLPARYYSSAG